MKERFDILFRKVLRKEATPIETEELLALLRDRDAKKDIYSIYENKWEEAGSKLDDKIQHRIFKNIKKEIDQPEKVETKKLHPNRNWLQYASIAAALILFLGGGFYFMTKDRLATEFIVSVDNGQKAQTQLPDGTKVWLNSETSILYSDATSKRNVHLEGEAYFEVAKNKRRPFIVHSAGLQIEALGTSFNVRAYPNEDCLTTTLIEGKVKVSDSETSLIMLPYDKVTYSKSSKRLTKTVVEEAEIVTSWRSNQMVFDKETLETIAKTLERMYNISVVFEEDKLKDIRFSGKIKNTNLESVLQMISAVSPVTYSLDDTQVTIKKNTE